jgi:hypothetical protein
VAVSRKSSSDQKSSSSGAGAVAPWLPEESSSAVMNLFAFYASLLEIEVLPTRPAKISVQLTGVTAASLIADLEVADMSCLDQCARSAITELQVQSHLSACFMSFAADLRAIEHLRAQSA